MTHIINSTVHRTYPTCPKCGAAAILDHGRDVHGLSVHHWFCRCCGRSMEYVTYPCDVCGVAATSPDATPKTPD